LLRKATNQVAPPPAAVSALLKLQIWDDPHTDVAAQPAGLPAAAGAGLAAPAISAASASAAGSGHSYGNAAASGVHVHVFVLDVHDGSALNGGMQPMLEAFHAAIGRGGLGVVVGNVRNGLQRPLENSYEMCKVRRSRKCLVHICAFMIPWCFA
jgi:hypothetical protein